MDPPGEITLWKAPQPGRAGAQEVIDGYDHLRYPGDGPYFARDKVIADRLQSNYGNGLQEINIPETLFQDLLDQGIVQPDAYYGQERSYHVPPAGLPVFNEAIKKGSPNVYHFERG